MPSATFSHRTATPLAPGVVWNLLQVPETWSGIGPVEEVWDAQHAAGHLESFRWATTVGHSRYEGTAETIVVEPGRKMRLALATRELLGSLTAELIPNGNASALDVTLEIESRGLMASLFFPAISHAVGDNLGAQVDDFAASLES